MLTVQKMLFLRKVDLFAVMSSRELGHVASAAEEIVYPAGSPIIREGDHGDSLFVIVEGEVSVHRAGVPFGTLREGACFGEMALLDGETRSASVTAAADCLVLCIRQADFQQLLSTNFEAVLAVLRTLCQRVRRAEARLKEGSGPR